MGKYLTNFKTKEEYEAFKAGGEYLTPNVSFIETAGSVINDSYQIPNDSMSSMEYLDLRGINYADKIARVARLVKYTYDGEQYITNPLIIVADDFGIPKSSYLAIEIDFLGMSDIGATYTATNEDYILESGFCTADQLAAIPRITKEEFYNLDNGGSSLIEFTIDGTPYQADEGMTWEQFVDSSYNDGRISISSNYVNHDGMPLTNSSGSGMSAPWDIIVHNCNYEYAAV